MPFHPRVLVLPSCDGVRQAVLAACIASLALTGCVADAPLSRGMSGVLNVATVDAASRNVGGVLEALQRDATINGYQASWYDVAVAGFNFVDHQCVDYFNDLFFLERRRTAIRSGLAAFAQTTDAILIATGAASVTLSVVAQAFGLAQKVTDIVADSFLYKLPPATTMGFVREMQSAYRIGVARDRLRINSPVEAYHEIQRYLELCLPPTIEARLVDHISGAKAVAVASPGDTQVVVGSDVSPMDRARIAAVAGILRDDTPRTALDPVRRTPSPNGAGQSGERRPATGFQGRIEQNLSPEGVQGLQSRLCVAQSGTFDDATRNAIRSVEAVISGSQINGIIDTDLEEDLISDARVGCSGLPTGAANTFEKFYFEGNDATRAVDQVKGFQRSIAMCVPFVEQRRPFENKPDLAAIATGVLDERTRTVIRYLGPDLRSDASAAMAATGRLSPSVREDAQNCFLKP